MKKSLPVNIQKSLMLFAGLMLAGTLAFGQYTPERIAGGAVTPKGLPAAVDDAYFVGQASPMITDSKGNLVYADYFNGGLVYWDRVNDLIDEILVRGPLNSGFGGPLADATVGDRIMGVAVDANDNIYFSARHQVLKVDMATRTLHHIAGSGGTGAPDFTLSAKDIDLSGAAGLALNHDESVLYLSLLNRNIVVAMDMATEKLEIIAGIDGLFQDFSPAGPGLSTRIRQPFGLTYIKDPVTAEEWVYFTTQQKTIYRYNVQTKIVMPVAGTGAWNQSGDGGLALNATLLQPHDIAVTADHRYMYFGDHEGNHHGIRRVDLNTGIIERVAGMENSPNVNDFLKGPAGRKGHPLEVPFGRAVGVTFDLDGKLIFSARNIGLIYKINSPDEMEVIAGYAPDPPLPPTADVPDIQATTMRVEAHGVTVKDGLVYFFDVHTRSIIRLNANGTTTRIAGNGESGYAGNATLQTAQFNSIRYMILDNAGNIYASDFGHHAVYKIDLTAETVTVVAGTGAGGYAAAEDGGPATAARLNQPHGIRFNPDESFLYIMDLNNRRLRRVEMASGIISTYAFDGTNGETNAPTARLAAKIQNGRDVVVDSEGNVYVATSQHKKIYKIDATNVTVFTPKVFSQPFGMHLDKASGLMWVADEHTVKTVDMSDGQVYTVAQGPPANWSIVKDGNDVYVSGRANGLYHFKAEAPGALSLIQGYADANDASEMTIVMLNELGTNTLDLNLAAYKTAVADSTAATLPMVESVQKLVNNVNLQEENKVIAATNAMAIASDASALTLDHLAIARLSNVIDGNLDAYKAVIAAATGVANKAALQSLINAANANVNLVLIDTMAKANDASALTFTLIRNAGATAANVKQNDPDIDYMSFYKAGVEAAAGVATTAELDAILVAANTAALAARGPDALAAIDAMAKADNATELTFKLMLDAGANKDLFNYEFLPYYKVGVADAAGVADAEALNAIITAANTAGTAAEAAGALAKIDAMAKASDASDLTRAMLLAAGATGIKSDLAHFEEYQVHIAGATGVASKEELQVLVDAANRNLAILKIVAFAEADDAGTMTGTDLVEAGVDPATILPGNLAYYRTAVAGADGSDVNSSEKIQALIDATNAQVVENAIESIRQMAVTGNADELTVVLLTEARLTFTEKYLDAYKNAIATAGVLADAAAIQALLTFTTNCESIREMAGTPSAVNLTIEMLEALNIVYAFPSLLDYYKDALFAADELNDCSTSLQTLITGANFKVIQEMAEFDDAEDLTIELLGAVGVINLISENLAAYKKAIENAGEIGNLAALQAIIDGVNTATSVTEPGVASLKVYPNPVMETLNIVSDKTIGQIRLVSLTGQVVYQRVVNANNVQISVSRFDKGLYMLQIMNAEGMSVERVMINR